MRKKPRGAWYRGSAAIACLVALSGCGNGFCSKHQCISNFDSGNGSIVQCADGEWSHSGGIQGACSGHGGEGGSSAGSNPWWSGNPWWSQN